MLTPSLLVPGGSTRTVCYVGAFRALYADLLSSLLSKDPVWRNRVVAECIFPLPLAYPETKSLHASHVSRERLQAPIQMGSLSGSVYILFEAH